MSAGVIVLTESHLRDEVRDGEVQIQGFESYRADRLHLKNGGVIMYVRSSLNLGVKVLLSMSCSKVEILLIKFERINMILIGVYRPPDTDIHTFRLAMIKVREIIETNNGLESSLVLTGDFNMPIISWSTREMSGGTLSLQTQAEVLLEFVDDFYMDQYVREPTRGANILDLFFTNNEDLVLKIEVQPPTLLSDHQLMIVTTAFQNKTQAFSSGKEEKLRSLNFSDNRIDWLVLESSLNELDWITLFLNKTATQMFEIFQDTLYRICDMHVPKKNHKVKSSIPKDRKVLMRKRCKLQKKLTNYDEVHRNVMLDQIIDIERKLADSHVRELQTNEARAVSRIRDDPKYFYRYARSKSVTKTPVGPFKIDNEFIYEPTRKSNILLKQYSSVYSSIGYNIAILDELSLIPGPRSMDTIDFSVEDIIKSIDDLSASSAPGTDGVPTLLLKNCKKALSTPLLALWQSSLNSSEIPSVLKFGTVIPIHKGGDKCAPSNYRPVTLTSHVIKIFEKVIVRKLVEYIDEAGLFNKHQHGFRRGRSCLSQLLEHYQLILQGLEMGHGVAVVYLDFCKAFDKVDHKIVLEKLMALGISGNLFKWIGNFLIGRQHVVSVDGVRSEIGSVYSGVPQGSVLGPLLFLIVISDIDYNLTSAHASSFADDTRVVMKIESEEDEAEMQRELEKIYEWAEQNAMVFNDAKFEHLDYRAHSRSEESRQFITRDGTLIKKPDEVKDLGVLMSREATFTNHIAKMIIKGKRQAGWILRTFKCRDHISMLTLYKATVLPLLEYCSQLWCPIKIGQIRKIEAVQRNFTSRVNGMTDLSYWERLRRLNMYSLERRRDRYTILYTYKVILGITPNFEDDSLKIVTRINDRRGLLCQVPPICTSATARMKTLVEQSFAVRGPRLFNCIPQDVRNINKSYESFKRGLDNFLAQVPDLPSLPNYPQPASSNSLVDQLEQLRRDGSYFM